jgi:hypothetical protein
MSAFMHRLAMNKVVDAKTAVEAENADTLDGKDSTAFLGKTEKAADADKLDGKDSTEFLGKTEKAADADKLDGKPSGDYISGATWEDRLWTLNNVFANSEKSVWIDCPGIDYPISGGGYESGNLTMADSRPYFNSLTDRGWQVSWHNATASTQVSTSGKIFVMCGDFELIAIPLATTDETEE